VRKKNKRKAPEFKKPFYVLSRKKIAGWFLVILFLCAWMFILGILVGRGTAPVKFDIAALEKKLEAAKGGDGSDQEKAPATQKPVIVEDKTKFEFYEALKDSKVDTNIPALKTKNDARPGTDKPADKTVSQKAQNETIASSTSPTPPSKKTEPQKPAPAAIDQKKNPVTEKEKADSIARTNAKGPVYTIQAASVKDPKDADRLVEKLKKRGYPAYRVIGKVSGKGVWFRVRIGEYQNKLEAGRVMNKLKKDGMKPILVMK